MPEPFKPECIHEECAHAFKDIAVKLGRIDERTEAQARKLDSISEAVLGNGKPQNSLSARVAKLEAAEKIEEKSADRFWKIAAVMIALVAVLIAFSK